MTEDFETWAKENHCLTDSAWKAWHEASAQTSALRNRVESLEIALRQLLAAAMPIRADNATLQQVARAIPELYDACHSASIVLRSNDQAQGAAQGLLRGSPVATGSAAGAPEKGKR